MRPTADALLPNGLTADNDSEVCLNTGFSSDFAGLQSRPEIHREICCDGGYSAKLCRS